MKHHVKSGAVTLSIIALAACSETVGPDSLEDSLTLDVAMIAADAAIDELGDMGLLFSAGAPCGAQCGGHTDRDAHRHLLRRGRD